MTSTPTTAIFPGVFNHPHPSEVITVGSTWVLRNHDGLVCQVADVTFGGVTIVTPTGEHTIFCSDLLRRYELLCDHDVLDYGRNPYRDGVVCADCGIPMDYNGDGYGGDYVAMQVNLSTPAR